MIGTWNQSSNTSKKIGVLKPNYKNITTIIHELAETINAQSPQMVGISSLSH